MEAKKAVAALADGTNKAAVTLKNTQEQLLAHRGQAILDGNFTAEDKGDWIKMIQKTSLDPKLKEKLIEGFEKANDSNKFRIAIEEYNKALDPTARLKSAQEGVLDPKEFKEEILEAQKHHRTASSEPTSPPTPASGPTVVSTANNVNVSVDTGKVSIPQAG